MGFGSEFYINGKFIDSYKGKRKYYYLYSNERNPIDHMNICYNSEDESYNEIMCAIKIGYINGNTKETTICKYQTKDYSDNTYINMDGVLIVMIYLDTISFPDDNEFEELFKKELELYHISNFGYPTDYDFHFDETDDISCELLGPMNSCTIASKNDSGVENDMVCD